MVTMASKIGPGRISQSEAYSSKIVFFEIWNIWKTFRFFDFFSEKPKFCGFWVKILILNLEVLGYSLARADGGNLLFFLHSVFGIGLESAWFEW